MEIHSSDIIHFIGIGGISMSGLAAALRRQGHVVSGSDKADSPRLKHLREMGITVHIGHRPENVAEADVVVYNTAIREDNPERLAAVRAGKRLHHRSEVLAMMIRGKHGIAVTGTHGKTTTSAMIAHILEKTGLDPTAFIGGDVRSWNSNYRLGRGEHVVFEACESDGTFIEYKNCSQVIGCVEKDHMDQHCNMDGLLASFGRFMALADPAGFLVYSAGCRRLQQLLQYSTAGRCVSFGLEPTAEYAAIGLEFKSMASRFTLQIGGRHWGEVHLQVPGEHNVIDALAAIAATEQSGVSVADAVEAIGSFTGTGRRFELLGRAHGIEVYDDYAHHPTEVRATLAAARGFRDRRIVAIFQPHLYSRTRDLMDDFAAAFNDADVVIINSIYAAREDPMEGVSSEELARRIQKQKNNGQVLYRDSQEHIVHELLEMVREGDLILTIGAGDIRRVGEEVAARLQRS